MTALSLKPNVYRGFVYKNTSTNTRNNIGQINPSKNLEIWGKVGIGGGKWGHSYAWDINMSKYYWFCLTFDVFYWTGLGFTPQYMYLNVFEIAYKLNKILTPPSS